jgi:hydroxypyruvate reductase
MRGAAAEATTRGYHVVSIDAPVVGEARVAAAAHIGAVLARASAVERPACFISSGETTVHVTGAGKGGRNQEFALAAAGLLWGAGVGTEYIHATGLGTRSLYGHPCAMLLASLGTDGVDGPTDAAGAMVDWTTLERARARELSADASLADNDTYAFFRALGDLITTGPTGTNVGDLQVILLA